MVGEDSTRYRRATPEDVEDIRSIARLCWDVDYPGVVSRESLADVVDEWYDAETIRSDVESVDAVVSVAESQDDVLGFAHAIYDEGLGTVLRLYVTPDSRGAGIGRSLLEFTVDELERCGAESIQAMVLAANEPGNAFYQRCGFEHTDVGQTYIGGEAYEENVYELGVDV